MHPPSGTVTFLFTDIEGSTSLWESHPSEMRAALARHDELLHDIFARGSGYVFKTLGDGFCAAFATAMDALNAAVEAQLAIVSETFLDNAPLRVRMALHSGAAELRGNDYFGQPLNRVSRLLAAAHGGQIILSLTAFGLVRENLPPNIALVDLGSHRLKDLEKPEQIFELSHPSLPSNFPPLRTLDRPDHPNNLPQQASSFIGREAEIARTRAFLDSHRLVTLLGPGGAGKTRLSLQAAAESLEQFPNGVWFIELAPLVDPNLIVQSICDAINLREESGQEPLQTLLHSLQTQSTLLVFDNCEHLLEASARLIDRILRDCANVRILASSREPLNIGGEQTYRIPALSLPDPSQPIEIATLTQYESVRLFIERALMVRDDFQVTNSNAPSLAALCAHLEGIPLAIELAAARVRSLSVEEIDSRLGNSLRILTGGSRTATPRQQTLRGAIDWSFQILSSSERRLMSRLAVFSGGWDIEEAERICCDLERDSTAFEDAIEDWQMLDFLTALADKSLIATADIKGRTRYRLLEAVRQYCLETLEASGEETVAKWRHCEYYIELTTDAWNRVRSSEGAKLMEQFQRDQDNLRTAIAWSLAASNEANAALRLCGELGYYWFQCGTLREGRRNLAAALSLPEVELDYRVRMQALSSAIWLAIMSGDGAASRALISELQTRAEAKADSLYLGSACSSLAQVYQVIEGDNHEAQTWMRKALAVFRTMPDGGRIHSTLLNLGILSYRLDEYDEAEAYLREARELFQQRNELEGQALCSQILGLVCSARGDYRAARNWLKDSLEQNRIGGFLMREVESLLELGSLAVDLGEYETARDDFQAAISAISDREWSGMKLNAYSGLGEALIGLNNFAGACKVLQDSATSDHLQTDEKKRASWLLVVAEYARTCGKLAESARILGAISATLEEEYISRAATPNLFDRLKETLASELGSDYEAQRVEGKSWSSVEQLAVARSVLQSPSIDPVRPS